MKNRLWSLTLGNFAIGTGAMIMPGMLNALTESLAVSPAAVGLLMSAFAATICLAGPVMAGLTSRIERRPLLAGCLLLYALGHLAAALAPGYYTLMGVRVLTAVGAGLFTSQAAATTSVMVQATERGRAIAMVFLGWSIAAVLGVPLGSWLSAQLGWRVTMALVALLAACCAATVWRQVPAGLFVEPMDARAWKSLGRNRVLLLVVAVTATQAAGQFAVMSYLALLLRHSLDASALTISVMFAVFGVAGVTGNVLGMRVVDRLGASRVAMTGMACMASAFALWPLAGGSVAATGLLVGLWGLGCFSVNGIQQARLVSLAPGLASASVALNSSAIYFGQAAGALVGGAMISASLQMHWLTGMGSALIVAAILMSQLAMKLSQRAGAAGAAA